ncbi:MAG: glycosyltransferase [Barnesiella sp.]
MYDNAPLVLREAAAMHTPAILLNGATASEVIVDGENGFLTENTVSGLARKISFLAESPQIIRLAGEAASHTIARSWEDVVHEVVDRYRVIQKKIK